MRAAGKNESAEAVASGPKSGGNPRKGLSRVKFDQDEDLLMEGTVPKTPLCGSSPSTDRWSEGLVFEARSEPSERCEKSHRRLGTTTPF
jgi:hypothetical protein